MKKWAPDVSVPAEYASIRPRWNLAHRSRTIAGQVAFFCFAAALVTA
jgi:hypothetical protein